MSNQSTHKTVNKNNSSFERKSTRWLMVLYDSLFYFFFWLLFFLFKPSLARLNEFFGTLVLGVLGYFIFIGFRFLFRCYKQIWRYGAIQSLARELFASLLGAFFTLLISYVISDLLHLIEISSTLLISACAVHIVFTMMARIFYWQVYCYAEEDLPFSRLFRWLLNRFAFVDFESKKAGAVHNPWFDTGANEGPINELQRILDQFALVGEVQNIVQINKGYINRTYKVVSFDEEGNKYRYTLQRINTNVFPDVDALMGNFKLTTEHLKGKFHLPGNRKEGAVPNIVPTKTGELYCRDLSGCWRMLNYFNGVYSLDIPDSHETFYYAGQAFGLFMKELSDLSPDQIKEVIPNFHNTYSRFLDLEKAISADPKGRVKHVASEIEFIRARASRFDIISKALEQGVIPKRICHNDCNMNNILFDSKTHLPVAIIDLDTVMPSTPLYDFGDSMRIGTNTAKDDEKDLSKVSCDLKLYEQYARGYLEACGEILTKEELGLLPYAALVITSEDGIRFLMDHIGGDTYYNIYYPGQNLDRARTQLKLVEDMERKLPEIIRILKKIYSELNLEADFVKIPNL